MIEKLLTASLCVALLLGNAALAQKSPGEHLDDATLTARVKLALLENSPGDGVNINVESSYGVVQLAGFVATERDREIAVEVAEEVDGVEAVSNRLRVSTGKRSPGRVLDDTILAAKVKLELAEDSVTGAFNINVEVRNAVVVLSGFVATYGERDAAVDLVSNVDGVADVINAIDITRGGERI